MDALNGVKKGLRRQAGAKEPDSNPEVRTLIRKTGGKIKNHPPLERFDTLSLRTLRIRIMVADHLIQALKRLCDIKHGVSHFSRLSFTAVPW